MTTPPAFLSRTATYRPATEAEVQAAAMATTARSGGLDFTGIKRWDLGIYTLIVFGILMFVLAKFAWPHIAKGLRSARRTSSPHSTQAKQDRSKRANGRAQSRQSSRLDETAGQVKAMLDEARRDADALKATEREAGVQGCRRRTRAGQARDRAARRMPLLKDIYEQAVQARLHDVREGAFAGQVSVEDHRRLLDESIAELTDGVHKT